ncbi:hypothetical protein LTR27_012431 [Elasticomyces elasticus]|nr:hypothetical protein LTR27_012431 [Elasticomyces elasticus]
MSAAIKGKHKRYSLSKKMITIPAKSQSINEPGRFKSVYFPREPSSSTPANYVGVVVVVHTVEDGMKKNSHTKSSNLSTTASSSKAMAHLCTSYGILVFAGALDPPSMVIGKMLSRAIAYAELLIPGINYPHFPAWQQHLQHAATNI